MGSKEKELGMPSVALFLFILLAVAGTTTGEPRSATHNQKVDTVPKARGIFAFGDSYADTGNRGKSASSWNQPYGITWPGYPSGRFSNGHVQTDYLADIIGLPTPTPYALSADRSIETGINFAIGGSGVTFAYGVPPLGSQIDNFELVLKTGLYSRSFLASSVTLVSNVGNDYSALQYTNEEIVAVIGQVVEGILQGLERLYELGLRNILVANLPPLSCLPATTIAVNYTSCVPASDPLIELHNGLLDEGIVKLNKFPDANYIILDEHRAFQYVLNNSIEYGIKEKFIPCCRGVSSQYNCGSVDQQGNLLYTLCDDPQSYMYWDGVHPTESTWNHVLTLFQRKTGFVLGAPTLELWLYQNSLRPAVSPAPAPSGPVLPQGAIRELEAAYNALISEPDFSEAIGLLQAVNLDEYLVEDPLEIVTVFLPNNAAFYSLPVTTIGKIYGDDQVLSVINFHTVRGYYNSSQLASGIQTLTTISNLELPVTSSPPTILIGPDPAKVVRPDLYKVTGQVVVHGIDKLLIPPSLF